MKQGVLQPINDETLAPLPPFVAAQLQALADEFGAERFAYHEQSGTIDHPYHDVGLQVSVWIASSDSARHWIHLGGSACWVMPDNHYLFFEAIPPALLPSAPDTQTWWVIYHDEDDDALPLHVYRITVLAESEVAVAWEDI